MGNYRKVRKDGTYSGKYSGSNKPIEGAGNRYVPDTPTFESTVTKGGQGTRGDKTFKIGAKEYDRPKEASKKDSKKKEEKLDAATIRTMRRMKDEEMLRKMGERYDAIMPSPEPGEAVPRQKKKDGGAVKKMAKGGVVKAACGASVPPAQKRK